MNSRKPFDELSSRSKPDGPETRFHDSDDQNSGEQLTLDKSGIAAGVRIGPYTLIQQIGEGGMGSVWLAEQKEPVRRNVALKIVKAGMDTREVIARFEAERQALALMNHANIAKVLDAGTTNQGRPYFVMELVQGIPITQFCDKHRLPPTERLELFVSVCHAVQHAHQKGIIHRDIKPSNVLVLKQDNQPVAKVIDFGLAKATGQKLTEKTLFTAMGQMVGTPAYMSPEQADATGLDIDTRTDVYSLGVLLYELLTGVTPIDLETIRSAGYAEVQRIVREQEPPKMSARLSLLGEQSKVMTQNRSTDSKRLCQLVRGDLDLIAMKAMEKERDRRYETPSSFAADVERFLNNEEIEARPASAGYRLKKMFRRNRVAVLTTSSVAAALLIGTIVSSWQAYRAESALGAEREANQVAEKRLDQLEKINNVIASVFGDLDPALEDLGGAPLRTQLINRMDEVSELIEGDATGAPLMVGRLELSLGVAQNNLGNQEKSLELLKRALHKHEANLGSENLESIHVLTELAQAENSLGKFPEAVEKLERAHKLLLDQLGHKDQRTIQCMSQLASSYTNAGEQSKGLDLQKEALKFANEFLGPQDEETLEIMSRLGGQHFAMNDREHDEECNRLYEEHLRLRIAKKGKKHYQSLQARKGLASIQLAMHKEKEAIENYQQVHAGFQEMFGDEHITTVLANCSVAYAYDRSGESDKGLKILAENVPRLKLLRGEDHPIYLDWLNLLAYSYEQNDQLEQAIKWHSEALRLREKKLGLDHPMTLTSISNLGFCCRRAGRYAEAIKYYQLGLPGFRKRYTNDNMSFVGYINNLGQALFQGDQFEDAEIILRECIPLLAQKLGETNDEWKVYRAKFWLGASLLGQAKYDEAETELLAGYQGMKSREENIRSGSRTHLHESMESLISLYSKRKSAGDAELEQQWTKLLESEKNKKEN